MKKDDVMFQAKSNGFTFIQDKDGFINVFDNSEDVFKEDSDAKCVYRTKGDCKTSVEFQTEIIYIVNKLETF